MPIGFGVSEIIFNDDTVEEIPTGGVIVIVGPNNVGKTSLINEIHQNLRGHRGSGLWVRSLRVERKGSEEDFKEWLRPLARVSAMQSGPLVGKLAIWSQQPGRRDLLSFEDATRQWTQGTGAFPVLEGRLISYLDAASRSAQLGGAARDSILPPEGAIDRLWDDRTMEDRLSQLTRRAFGFDVTINRYSQNPQLLIGRTGVPDEPPPASRKLLDAYATLPPVASQGDGVKSFVGIVLQCISGDAPAVLIDEPEAFLHPPQAKLLGRYLRDETSKSSQVIIATHSSDVLNGLLDGSSEREIKIIRLSVDPETGVRRRNTLPPDRVKRLHIDPLLRYSRMLDGLFHRGVLVCESDGDCRFYSAVLDTFLKGGPEHDLFLTHVGGKARLPAALAELNAFGVKTAVIGDLDVLNDQIKFSELIDAAGGNYEDFASDLSIVQNEVKSRVAAPTVGALRSATRDLLRRPDSSALADDESERVIKAAKNRSGWKEVKRSGTLSFEGEAAMAVERVLRKCNTLGIFLVPVGELERWYPAINAGHGISFVTAALEAKVHETLPGPLSEFISGVVEYFSIQVRDDALKWQQ